ncbi:DDE_superfamily endonuclease domain-containing protein [Hexamita inflata]|uniref:DDE superfamily endonuclease domain-containing protein n=1 Tax=Hexamita inflata TaxID=28002 RepID=A0AA86PFZ2_9EUKA|nr:DDE superfamily endonuclease domain-containing protein [Hexamita inflata]
MTCLFYLTNRQLLIVIRYLYSDKLLKTRKNVYLQSNKLRITQVCIQLLNFLVFNSSVQSSSDFSKYAFINLSFEISKITDFLAYSEAFTCYFNFNISRCITSLSKQFYAKTFSIFSINVVHQQQGHPEFTPDQIQEAANTEPHVSPTTVYNALKDKELMDLIGESTMSYVRSVDRVANANSPENKMARLENILEYESKVGGKVRVFVDESHWTLGGLRQYGWVETGHKRLNNFNEVNYSITALSAIVETGVAYTEIAIGNITADIFEAFMCNLIAWLKDAVNDADCVFYLDNASIHKDRTQLIVNQAKHSIHFAHPNSCELNPIENIFGIWKGKVESIRGTINTRPLANILKVIATSFFEISPNDIIACIRRVQRTIYVKVHNQEDI